MLAETICCLFIVMTVSVCTIEAFGTIAAISKRSRDKRMRVLDYFSIINEANARFETSHRMERGEWIALVTATETELETRKGMKVVEIFVISYEGREKARWKLWKIDGRD